MTNAASETRRMKGYITCVSRTVSPFLAGSKPGARSPINGSAKSTPRIEIRLMKTAVMVAIFAARRQAEASPSVAIFRENVVTNAVDRAPSAKRSRRRLGARNATINASILRPAPNRAANNRSRNSPSTRLSIIAKLTTPAAFVADCRSSTAMGVSDSVKLRACATESSRREVCKQ